MKVHTIRIEVIKEHNTMGMSFYTCEIGGILGSGIYLNSDQLRQQFGGTIPDTLTINITGEEKKGIYLNSYQLRQQFGGTIPDTLTINITGEEKK